MSTIFRDRLLDGRTAVITGGGSGICQTIAERYAEHGAAVVLIGRTQEKLDRVAEGIRSRGGRALGVAADVRDFAAMEAAFATAHRQFGPIDLVVAGAAGNFPAPAAALSAKGFRAVVDIDLAGTFHTCRAAFEYLRTPGAHVLAISATQAFTPTPLQAHVCAAKAGVDALVKTLALEWGPLGVRLNVLCPGPIDDTEGMRRLTPDEASRDAVTAAIPLGRYGTRSEMADLALFLATGAAAYMTGAVLVADGGISLGGSRGMMTGMT